MSRFHAARAPAAASRTGRPPRRPLCQRSTTDAIHPSSPANASCERQTAVRMAIRRPSPSRHGPSADVITPQGQSPGLPRSFDGRPRKPLRALLYRDEHAGQALQQTPVSTNTTSVPWDEHRLRPPLPMALPPPIALPGLRDARSPSMRITPRLGPPEPHCARPLSLRRPAAVDLLYRRPKRLPLRRENQRPRLYRAERGDF